MCTNAPHQRAWRSSCDLCRLPGADSQGSKGEAGERQGKYPPSTWQIFQVVANRAVFLFLADIRARDGSLGIGESGKACNPCVQGFNYICLTGKKLISGEIAV